MFLDLVDLGHRPKPQSVGKSLNFGDPRDRHRGSCETIAAEIAGKNKAPNSRELLMTIQETQKGRSGSTVLALGSWRRRVRPLLVVG